MKRVLMRTLTSTVSKKMIWMVMPVSTKVQVLTLAQSRTVTLSMLGVVNTYGA
jgi:hypothetical protein